MEQCFRGLSPRLTLHWLGLRKGWHLIHTSLLLLIACIATLSGFGQTRHPAKAPALLENVVVTRVMFGGSSHSYTFELRANEFCQVLVEQHGIDVILKMSDASGKILATMDSPNGTQGPETLTLVASTTGRYLLEVVGAGKKSVRVRYTIRRQPSRTATEQDIKRVELERLFFEGVTAKNTDEAIVKLDSVAAGWRELGDQYLAGLAVRRAKYLKAGNLFQESLSLIDEETDEASKAALQKLKEAQSLYLEIGNKLAEAHVLMEMAEISMTLGDPDTALKSYEQALTQFRIARDTSWEATVLNNLGLIHHKRGDRVKALSYYEQSLPLLVKLGESPEKVITLNNIGAIYLETEEYQRSLRYLRQALALAKLKKDKAGEARSLSNLGHVYLRLKDYPKALAYFNQVLPLRRTLNDKKGEMRTLEDIARAKSEQEFLAPPADTRLPVGRSIERQLNSSYKDDTYRVGLKKGQVLRVDLEEKGINVSMRLMEFKDLASRTLMSINLGNGYARETLAYVVEQTGDYFIFISPPESSSGGSYRLTANIEAESPAGTMRASAVQLLAEALDSFDERTLAGYQQAVAKWQESLNLWTRLGDKYWQGYTNNYLGVTSYQLDEMKGALDHYKLALSFERDSGDKYGEAITLSNIGTIFHGMGEDHEALKYYQQSLPLLRALDCKKDEAINLSNIGSIYNSWHRDQDALTHYEQALTLFKAVGSKRDEAIVLSNTGAIYADRGENQKALRYYKEALAIDRELKNTAGQARSLNNMAQLEDDVKDANPIISFAYYTQALRLAKGVGDRSAQASIFHNMTFSWMGFNGNRRAAILFGKLSVNLCQELRTSAQGLDSAAQMSFLREMKLIYRRLAELLIAEGQLQQAVRVLNLYQDQRFFDVDRDARVPLPQVPLSAREQKYAPLFTTAGANLEQTRALIDDLDREIEKGQPSQQQLAQAKKLDTELASEVRDFLTFLLEFDQEFGKPLDENDRLPPFSDLTEMQSALRELSNATGQKAATIYTLIGDGYGRLYLLLVTADAVKVFESPIDAKFRDRVWQFYALLQRPTYDPRILGAELYGIIIKPIDDELKQAGIKTLMWSLEDILRYIPVAALWDGNKYLVEQYQNVVLTRADRERMTRKVSANWTGTGFGSGREHVVDLPTGRVSFPALPGVTQELQTIFGKPGALGILAGEVFSDERFTESAFYNAINKGRPVVHISSHFSLYPGNEYRSFLLLGDGKTISLASLKGKNDLFQRVELLTLSTCDSASQLPNDEGREIDGFAELAQRLGAGSVLASLWKVRAGSTAQLMVAFYKKRQAEKLNKAAALRAAQLELLNGRTTIAHDFESGPTMGNIAPAIKDIVIDDKYSVPFKTDPTKPFAHPYFWSPFVLFGNWQ